MWGFPIKKARYVFAEASAGVGEASCEVQEPDIFLKVCAPPELVQPLLHHGWNIKQTSFIMTSVIVEPGSQSIPTNYKLDHCVLESGHALNIFTDTGDLAASGRVFLVGETAVFDRIETHPTHRRRGLGRLVVSELGRLALQSGASKGALVATPEGRALYSTMGWQLHSLYTTAVRIARHP